ncbi:tripartite tricarboxylate transporter TctB family protein [Fodinicurvata sp. EGI_FJ10296]|uniref:tripartite tricarboxylate transporter TctB family protein n=1 Tax=Fodinicurvata sp. EGI_FJ10296 TaxID=3231908 RepID=UPI003453A64E
MTNTGTNNGQRYRKMAGELIVPLIMVGFLGAYWWQAAGLSASAVSFPMTLTGVLVVLLVVQIVLSCREIWKAVPGDAEDGDAGFFQRIRGRQLVAPAQRLGMMALGAGLFVYWRELGGTLVILLFTFGVLVMLGERRWPVLLLMPVGLTVALSYLFKAVLSVRFPDGLLALF